MIESKKVDKILYGGDYNPEQWPEEVWAEDMRLFKLAGIDVVTLNVFSWAMLQPSEDTYDFSKLDRIMELCRDNGLKICLATSTAAHPAWMAHRHPDILRVEKNGMKRRFGSRHNSCPNSPTYRKYSVALASKLAERYSSYDNIVAWHVSNEFGGECYCDNCARAFRDWVKQRYGTIERVNEVWNTAFWGHTFYDFEEIVPSDLRSEEFPYWMNPSIIRTNFQGITLDYMRFNSDSMLECFKLERDALKAVTPDIPVTTNMMGFYKNLDYAKWAKEMDFASWDNYPGADADMAWVAAAHDTMRGIKYGKPFCLMEQTPGVTNWHPYCKLKRPGVMRLWSYQAVARGADTVMFFQMRRSQGACEKYHSAVIDHAGHEDTRVFREVSELGAELKKLGSETLGSRINSKIAILFDWDNWWAAEMSAGPSDHLHYLNEVIAYYKALYSQNIPVDIVPVDTELSSYSLVIAPLMYMNKPGLDERIREYVKKGGCYITTCFSGYVDENDRVLLGGYPAKQRDIIGLWVEESDALSLEEKNMFVYKGREYPAYILCDLLRLENAQMLSCYEKEFYKGTPVLTKNSFGEGTAYYVGTHSDDKFYAAFLTDICEELGISPICRVPRGVEVTMREKGENKYLFVLNHNPERAELRLPYSGTDLLTDTVYKSGAPLSLEVAGVVIMKLDK